MRKSTIIAVLAVFAAPFAAAGPDLKGAESGSYELEKNHAFLTWSVRHNGISDYTVNFTDFDATLVFDAEDPEKSRIMVTVNPRGLQTQHPDAVKKAEWETKLTTSDKLLNADRFAKITFTSTKVEQTGDFAGKVTGDLTFLGMTRPVTLDVSFGGVANVPWFGQRDLLGFTASTVFKRSDFGMDAYMSSVSDEVRITFSGEFLQAE